MSGSDISKKRLGYQSSRQRIPKLGSSSRIIVDGECRVIRFRGRKYRLVQEIRGKDQHVKAGIFEPVSDVQWNRKVSKLAKRLVGDSGLSAYTIVRDALNGLDLEALERLEVNLVKGAKVKVKRGCLSLVVGKAEVPLLG